MPRKGFFPPRIDVVDSTMFFLPLNCTTSKSKCEERNLKWNNLSKANDDKMVYKQNYAA